MTLPPLSVVIIGRNEGDRLARCVASVRQMEYAAPVEIIYVDSASTDHSVPLASSLGVLTVEVRPLRPTAAMGRNAGWRIATSPFVLFLDGDTIVHPRFAVEALPQLDVDNVALVWGHRREIAPHASIYNRVLDLDWIYRTGIVDLSGGDVLARRSALERVGGFDESLIAGEEPEMCRRLRGLNYTIVHIDHPMTGHDLAMHSWRQYWKRALRAGYAYAEVSRRFEQTELPFWGVEVRRNRDRALLWTALPIVALLLCSVLHTFVPALAAVALFALFVVRTAWNARWKSADPGTLLLYGLHSQVQQIPIFCGQLQWAWDKAVGKKRGLIEYKEV
jgi:cellulose synthase/poly-beta-1,6-N-acetylglucosamine synthase-like glycosyltransferase